MDQGDCAYAVAMRLAYTLETVLDEIPSLNRKYRSRTLAQAGGTYVSRRERLDRKIAPYQLIAVA